MKGVFYGQTEYSYLENAIHLEKYVTVSKERGHEFLTITDNNMHGYYKFYNLCIKNNIKPIIGLKINLSSNLSENNFYLAYAKNDQGLSNLFSLTKEQEINKKISIDYLTNHKEGLFIVSSGYECDINNLIINNKIEEAISNINLFNSKNIEFYLGVNLYDELYNDNILEVNNVRTLPLAKTSFINKEDFNVYITLKKIGNHKDFSGKNNYIKSIEQLNCDFNKFKLYDSSKLIDDIKYNSIMDVNSLPIFDKDVSSSTTYLKELTAKGLNRRLAINNKENLLSIYKKRLDKELEIIDKMGYSDYFLIVWDFIKYAKNNKILVGPGRGSAAGSLVSYCLGITEVDPLEYNLFFERFLNPDRITMPDIDIDFPDNRREEVIQYVKNRYGVNNVCYISAFNTLKVKSSIRDICRVNNVKLEYANLVYNYLEENGIDKTIEHYKGNPELLEVVTVGEKINGLVRHISTHAAGIIISSIDLTKSIPLKAGLNGVYQSQLESSDLEEKGFLKIDFLGITNLTLLDKMQLKMNLPLKEIKYNDKKTFELLKRGDTDGVFQLESSGIKNVLRKLSPSCFEDLVAVLALYRPGPMDNIDVYISGKHKGNVKYLVKELEPILKETYGVIVYQEQIMQIANVIAGYSYAEADILRRAVSKKDKNILDENKDLFVKRAILKGFTENVSIDIYNLIVKFANYGFNKSHSVAYAMLSYQMAYIKANYPIIFISTMIDNVVGNQKEISKYVNYAKSKNIKILNPNINISTTECVAVTNGIYLPLQAVKKLGNNTAKCIIEQRSKGVYNTFEEFKDRTKEFVTLDNLKSLIYASAFDYLKFTKKHLINLCVEDSSFARYNQDKKIIKEEYDFSELRNNELEHLGFNLKYDLFNKYENQLKLLNYVKIESEIVINKFINVVGYINNIKEIETKNKDKMAFVDLDLNFMEISAVVFPDDYSNFININKDALILFNVQVQKRNEELQLVLKTFKNIT